MVTPEYLTSLTAAQLLKFRESINTLAPVFGLAREHHLNRHFKRMSFINRDWLQDLYAPPGFFNDIAKGIKPKTEMPQFIVFIKPVQVGITERLLVELLHYVSSGLRGLYVMPNQTLRSNFVHDRIDKLLSYVPLYKSHLDEGGESDSVLQKHYGKGTMRFVGSNSRTEFVENPVDIAFVDEYDESDMDNLDQLKDRLKASEYKMLRYSSRPTVENCGVDGLYRSTNQSRYLTRCQHCNKYIELDWFKHVVRQVDSEGLIFKPIREENGKPQIICDKCEKIISEPWVGEWIAKYPDKPRVGYRFSRLISFDTDLLELWNEFQEALGDTTKTQLFHNSNLGRAFAPKGSKITEALMEKCKDDYLMPSTGNNTFMGVDPGGRHHYFIWERYNGRKRLVACGAAYDWDTLDFLIDQYNVEVSTIDGEYDTTKAKELQASRPGKVWLCWYKKGGSLQDQTVDIDNKIIALDRTQALDRVLKNILKSEQDGFILPRNWRKVSDGELLDHFTLPVRYFDPNTNRQVWSKPISGDHLLHAAAYSLISEEIGGTIGGSMVWSRAGKAR